MVVYLYGRLRSEGEMYVDSHSCQAANTIRNQNQISTELDMGGGHQRVQRIKRVMVVVEGGDLE